MTKPYYNPRNRNDRTNANPKSWSDAFEDGPWRERNKPTAPCGFRESR
jgi:hypothetical protein